MATTRSLPLENGERSLLQRGDIRCKFSGDIKRTKDSGTIYLTNYRIIFVPLTTKRNPEFWRTNCGCMSLRFSDIRHERFNQPIFGANNIAGRIFSEALSGAEVKWKFHFYSGGVGTFLMAFLELMKNTRNQARQLAADQAPIADARPIMAEAQVAEAILSAPSQQSDPTVVWISDVYLVPDYEAHDGDMQEAVAIAVPER